MFDGLEPGDGVQLINTDGADGDDTENGINFLSTVSYFSTTERTTNATLSFTACSNWSGYVST